MKKLFAAIIPALLITFLVVYSSCNEVPVENTLLKSNDNAQHDITSSSVDNTQSITNEKQTLNDAPANDGKDTQINAVDENKNQTDASGGCGVGIGPNANVTILTGTQYSYTYNAWAGVRYSANVYAQTLVIYRNNIQLGAINNWTEGFCGGYPPTHSWNNSGGGTLSLGAGTHTFAARLIYGCNINGQNYYIDTTVYATVIVNTMNAPSIPNVSFWTTGPQSARRPRLTWTASTPNITNYVIQRRYYPSGSFSDFATVSGSTFEFIDNSITVVTDRYDLVYYNVEYRVRAVNPVGSSGYQAPSYEWYKHGCYSHSLGYKCAIE